VNQPTDEQRARYNATRRVRRKLRYVADPEFRKRLLESNKRSREAHRPWPSELRPRPKRPKPMLTGEEYAELISSQIEAYERVKRLRARIDAWVTDGWEIVTLTPYCGLGVYQKRGTQ
jgi:hypothetical protein